MEIVGELEAGINYYLSSILLEFYIINRTTDGEIHEFSFSIDGK